MHFPERSFVISFSAVLAKDETLRIFQGKAFLANFVCVFDRVIAKAAFQIRRV